MLFENISNKMSKIFKKLHSKGKLTAKDIDIASKEIKLALLEADVNIKMVKEFVSRIKEKSIGADVLESLTPSQQVIKIVKDELADMLGSKNNLNRINFPSKGPCVIMMCGLQGSGKTTNAAKLAKYYLKKGNRPLLVACDIYRPAAVEQLKVVGEEAGVEVFSIQERLPLEIVKSSLNYAKDYGYDLIIIDTAGRLHIDDTLMNELKQIKDNIKIDETLFVADAMTGQSVVEVAKSFDDKIDITGVILTKLDGDSRAGAALSILYATGKPIKFIGVGEKLDDLDVFNPDGMASRILGMGDILALIEKAENNVKIKDIKNVAEKIKKNSFDMNDLLNQMKQIKKLGSIKNIVGIIPGMAGKVKDEDLEKSEEKINEVEAIINSMTRLERNNPSIINFSRKKRISAGSGKSLAQVNQLLKQFEIMQKLFKKFGGKKGRLKNMLFPKFM